MKHSVHALAAALALAPLAWSTVAQAHISMVEPAPRYADQKTGPCGKATGDARSTNINYFEPGQTITVTWDETIDHPSHYRISFDADGTDGFADPPAIDAYNSNDYVLLDEIEDGPETRKSATVTLPDMECDNCTLQLIQVMYDKPPYQVPGNDLYYQCADIVLVEGGGPAPGVDGGAPAPGVDGGAPAPGVDGGAPAPGSPTPEPGVGGGPAPTASVTDGCAVQTPGREAPAGVALLFGLLGLLGVRRLRR